MVDYTYYVLSIYLLATVVYGGFTFLSLRGLGLASQRLALESRNRDDQTH
ncbi:MAG: hypothetical protein H7832_06375 [Magnetococcus sp. DMHC-6]